LGVNLTSQNAINNVQRTNPDIELKKEEDVNMHQMDFQSEGLEIVGNLFRPQNFKEGSVISQAILVGDPMTGVKE
jgi:hypothetical protein